MSIKHNAERLLEETQGRTLVAATKYVGPDDMRQLYEGGIRDFGENRVNDFLKKKEALDDLDGVAWHFIGHLQSKKVKQMINAIDMLHSLDHASLLKEIEKRRETPLPCFVEVNISGESSKYGLDESELRAFCEKALNYDKINIVGLMGMAPYTDDEKPIRDSFMRLRQLRDDIRDHLIPSCTKLSMGMSNDYKIAMDVGATHLRIGSILFKEEV